VRKARDSSPSLSTCSPCAGCLAQAKYEGRHVAKLLLRTNDTDLGSSRTEVSVRAHVMLGALAHDKHAVNFR
jgi:hypothetical protein